MYVKKRTITLVPHSDYSFLKKSEELEHRAQSFDAPAGCSNNGLFHICTGMDSAAGGRVSDSTGMDSLLGYDHYGSPMANIACPVANDISTEQLMASTT